MRGVIIDELVDISDEAIDELGKVKTNQKAEAIEMTSEGITQEDRTKLIKEISEYLSDSDKFRDLLSGYTDDFCDVLSSKIYGLQDRMFTLSCPVDEDCEYLGKQSD